MSIEDIVGRLRKRTAKFVRDRADISCADPEMHRCRHLILNLIEQGILANRKPQDIARRLRKAFPALDVPWDQWVCDEIVIAHAKADIESAVNFGISYFAWVALEDSCMLCKEREAEGPYLAESCLIPCQDSHSGCLCVLAPCA